MKFLLFVVILLQLSTSIVFGQSNVEIEKELVGHIKNIQAWTIYRNKSSEGLDEKRDNENRIFKNKLLKYTSSKSSTLDHKFPELNKHLFIATSDDGNLRVYSWDTESGGSMHFYEDVYQYRSKNSRVYSSSKNAEEGDVKPFVLEIFTLKTASETFYLVTNTLVLSTSLRLQSINSYKIEDNQLKDAKIIKTRSGITNSISFEYDFFSVVVRKERPIKLFSYDKPEKTLTFPVVIADEKKPYGKVTNKFIAYKFDGKYFVKIGYQE